jgi:hypothetical protein
MSVKTELNKLKTEDIYSLLLFTLYKSTNSPEYSALSQLAFILDEHSLLNLCEYFGGITITIPKIEELEELLKGLDIYKQVHIDGKSADEVFAGINATDAEIDKLKQSYVSLSSVMANYDFSRGTYEY